MKKSFILSFLLLSSVIFTALPEKRLQAGEKALPKGSISANLERKYDVIKVSGGLLGRFQGVPVNRLSVLAFRNGELMPIPFQVDERGQDGKFVMTSGRAAGRDQDSGKLDANDELVFLVADSGDRLPEAERLAGGARIEIEMTDPRYPDRHAWAYLAKYKEEPPRSNRDYVDYDPATGRFKSDCCTIGYQEGLGSVFYHDLIYSESFGGDGKDFIDRIKFRFKVDFLGGRVALERSEECFTATVQGWKDGPVRVLHYTTNHIRVFESLPPISFDNTGEYYPHMMTTPLLIRFPLNINLIIKLLGVRTFRAEALGDLPGMVGGKAYTNLGMDGYTYTGNASKEEMKKIEKKGIVWGLATKQGVGTWFPRIIFPDVINQFNYFYFTDDLSLQNPPENVPGEIGNGLIVNIAGYPPEILDWLGSESFVLRLDTYYASPGIGPKEALEWLDMLDYPLFIDTHGGGVPKRNLAEKPAGTGPPWELGQDGVIMDTKGRKFRLKGIAYFIGSPMAAPRITFLGERVKDQTFHVIRLEDIRSIENHYMEYEPVTKSQMALFTKVTPEDGESMDLLSCKACGWAGADQEGMVIYFSNSQIKRIDFEE